MQNYICNIRSHCLCLSEPILINKWSFVNTEKQIPKSDTLQHNNNYATTNGDWYWSEFHMACEFSSTTRCCHYFEKKGRLLSGVPDYFDRNKILSGYDLSHYQVPHCNKSFLLFCLICVYSSQFSILFWIMYLLWHFGYLPIIKFEFC